LASFASEEGIQEHKKEIKLSKSKHHKEDKTEELEKGGRSIE
jgi:hypothetical protein